MATDLQCNQCGKPLRVDASPGATIACPGCGKNLKVPSVVSAMPTPKILDKNGQIIESQVVDAGPSALAEDYYEEEEGHHTRVQVILNESIPWVISLVFHMAVLLLLLFMVWRYQIIDPEKIIIPDTRLSETPGGLLNPEHDRPDMETTKTSRVVKAKTAKESSVNVSDLNSDKIEIIGVGASSGGGPVSGFDLAEGGGPRSNFYGTGGNARKIVYLIDRSGSMADTFDYVRNELMSSIAGLVPEQSYHVIFFSRGRPEENPARKLIPANEANKKQTYVFLENIRAEGMTDPRQAVRRAFQVSGGPPELIYLLTDGEFDKAVLNEIRRMNAKGRTKINTIAFVYKVGEKLLRQIAKENGGRYKHVSEDEVKVTGF